MKLNDVNPVLLSLLTIAAIIIISALLVAALVSLIVVQEVEEQSTQVPSIILSDGFLGPNGGHLARIDDAERGITCYAFKAYDAGGLWCHETPNLSPESPAQTGKETP